MTVDQWILVAVIIIAQLLAIAGLFYLHIRDRRERRAKIRAKLMR